MPERSVQRWHTREGALESFRWGGGVERREGETVAPSVGEPWLRSRLCRLRRVKFLAEPKIRVAQATGC